MSEDQHENQYTQRRYQLLSVTKITCGDVRTRIKQTSSKMSPVSVRSCAKTELRATCPGLFRLQGIQTQTQTIPNKFAFPPPPTTCHHLHFGCPFLNRASSRSLHIAFVPFCTAPVSGRCSTVQEWVWLQADAPLSLARFQPVDWLLVPDPSFLGFWHPDPHFLHLVGYFSSINPSHTPPPLSISSCSAPAVNLLYRCPGP